MLSLIELGQIRIMARLSSKTFFSALTVKPLPEKITKSALYNRISNDSELRHCLGNIRLTAEALGEQIARVLPSYTDHSIKHMDALWGVADKVFTVEEIAKFSEGEAFVLGASFYVHDLGMALASTQEGIEELRKTDVYTAAYERSRTRLGEESRSAEQFALEIAGREIHAIKAIDFVQKPLPGLQRYLIESSEVREHWGHFIGQVSASHHWSLQTVGEKLGARGRVPDAIGGELDLGFLACGLRLIDYAHINLERASVLDQLLRSSVDSSSIIHWKAQQSVTGPNRQDDLLVFGSVQPVRDVDAWWLFYEMAAGLNSEIHNVGEYLRGRKCSSNRFSLEGVKGIQSPHNFSTYVAPDGFEPVDVRFRPDSVERLIEILGGPTLYGNDFFAPIRELLQNARDATALKLASRQSHDSDQHSETITVSIKNHQKDHFLSVIDNGVGMTSDVVTTYLLGIASDYWHSSHFFNQYPGVALSGFKPTGRFGIGFLSVFMIGDSVEVITQRYGGPRITLNLHGLGRRGALMSNSALSGTGTTVRVKISKHPPEVYEDLHSIVRARAPMLDIPIRVEQLSKESVISPGWWASISQEEFYDFIAKWERTAKSPPEKLKDRSNRSRRYYAHFNEPHEPLPDISAVEKWPAAQPEAIEMHFRAIAIPKRGRMLVCSRGISVATFGVEGMIAMIQLDEIKLDAARSTPVGWDLDKTKQQLLDALRPKIVSALDSLVQEAMVPSRFKFLADVAGAYGEDVLKQTTLPWLTVMVPPGNAILLSAEQFKEKASITDEILIGYDTSPWDVGFVCHSQFPSASNQALLIPVSSAGQPAGESYKEEDQSVDSLPGHFEEGDDYAEAHLLTVSLSLIAEAWNISVQDLINHKWHSTRNGSLVAHFTRRN